MRSRKNYLLTVSAPTPNGRLHLGHIGAQFLKLDVLKRHFQRAGDGATVLFSVDAFDNVLSFTAWQNGISEAEVCALYIEGIKRDLEDLAISFDGLLDISAGEGRTRIHEAVVELSDILDARKITVAERIPFSRRTGGPVTGRFLVGECPVCARTIHGYSCDPCGLYFSAEQIRNARAADPTELLDWREVANDFIRVDSQMVLDYLSSLPVPPVTRRKIDHAAAELLAGEHFLARWTASEPWGIGTGTPGQVYFNRVLVTLAEEIVFGELAKEQLHLSHNPFDVDSSAVTIYAFGVDNLGAILVEGSALTLATERYRPYDFHLVSEFYLLAGEKMSTSRPHAIWVADAAALPEFSRDGLRAYMASIAIPDVEVDVSQAEMTDFMKTLASRLDGIAAVCSRTTGEATRADSAVLARAADSLEMQAAALKLPYIDLPGLWRTTDEWIDRVLAEGSGDRQTSLAAFAIIASPLIPDIAEKVWRLLGRQGNPDCAALRKVASGEE